MQNEDQPRYLWIIVWIIWVSSAVILVIIGLAVFFSSGERGQLGNQASSQPTRETRPVAVATPTLTCPDAQERAYFSMVSHIENEALPNINGFLGQATPAQIASNFYTPDEWSNKTTAYIVELQKYIKAVRELSPPGSMMRVHDSYLWAVDALEEALDSFVLGVNNLDERAIERSVNGFQQYFQFDLNTAITDFCSEKIDLARSEKARMWVYLSNTGESTNWLVVEADPIFPMEAYELTVFVDGHSYCNTQKKNDWDIPVIPHWYFMYPDGEFFELSCGTLTTPHNEIRSVSAQTNWGVMWCVRHIKSGRDGSVFACSWW